MLEGGLVLTGVLLRGRMWVCVWVGGRVRGTGARVLYVIPTDIF